MTVPEVEIVRGWSPGLLGWIVAEHGLYYAREWRLGRAFEAKVAEGLGALAARPPGGPDLLLSARAGGITLGALAIDGSGANPTEGRARIRYFILTDAARGRGIGRRLFEEAMAFILAEGFRHAWLTTFAGLEAARHLYESVGFRLVREEPDTTWGALLTEQTFEWSA